MSTDESQVRGFAAFPPLRGRQARHGTSWWARAWIRALEDTSLDERQLRQGRAYATSGRVGSIAVSPGRIAAPVLSADGALYHTVVLVERLTDAEWARFLEQVASESGRIAALLDRDMPRGLVEAADEAGVQLLPGIGDLEPECDCGDWELPCRHAAALCYQTAWLLDHDPLLLLLLRGRGESRLLEELQRHNAPSPCVGQPGASHGESADDAYARPVPPLPDAPPWPVDCGALPELGPAPGVDPQELTRLAAEAAARARHLLDLAGLRTPRPAPRRGREGHSPVTTVPP